MFSLGVFPIREYVYFLNEFYTEEKKYEIEVVDGINFKAEKYFDIRFNIISFPRPFTVIYWYETECLSFVPATEMFFCWIFKIREICCRANDCSIPFFLKTKRVNVDFFLGRRHRLRKETTISFFFVVED